MPPTTLLIIGFLLSLLGFGLPLLMVIHVLPSTFFLNFFSFGASMSGPVLGILGGALYVRHHRRK